MPRSTY